MAWYEFLVAPPSPSNKPSPPLVKVRVESTSYFGAKQQSEAIYGKDSNRTPIVPKK